MCISPSAATARASSGRSSTCSSSNCSPASGTARTGTSSAGACTISCCWLWKSSSSCPTSKRAGSGPHIYTLFLVVVGWAMFVGNDAGVEFGLLFRKLFIPSGGVMPPLLPAQLRRTAGGLRRLLHPAHRKAVEAAFPQCHHQGADHSGAADGLDGLRRGQHQQPVPVFQLLRGGVNDGQTFKALHFDFPLSNPYGLHPVF